MLTDGVIPASVQGQIYMRVEAFNKKKLSKSSEKYYAVIKGKFVYLKRNSLNGLADDICRLTYNGDLEDMHFVIYRYSIEKYDPNEHFFHGHEFVDGTLEGAMKAGLEAYHIGR